MADPNKYKSVSVPKETYETLEWLRKGNIIQAELTFSKVIEYLAKSKMEEIQNKTNEWNSEKNLILN